MTTATVPAEWKELLSVCRKFAESEIIPGAPDADRNSDHGFIRKTLGSLSDLGMPGILVPEELGGAGLGALPAALALDVLSGACASTPVMLAYHYAAQTAVLEDGSDDQKKHWIGASAGTSETQTELATCFFSKLDPPAEDDRETLALEKEEATLYLNGRAGLTPGAGLASFFVVFVRPRGYLVDGPLTCLLIPADRAGIEIGEREIFSGLKAFPINPVSFDKVRIEAEDIISINDAANGLEQNTRHILHAFLGAIAMGVARSAYEKAVAYACERYQYGKTIAHHQAIQRMLGQMQTKLHAGTALYMQALSNEPMDGICSNPRGEHAKIFCTDAALEITLDAIQVHGGYGYMQDYGVEKLMRDAKMLQLLAGPNPILQIETARTMVE